MRAILSTICFLFFVIAFILFYHYNPAVQRIALHTSMLFVSLIFAFACCGLGWPIASRLAAGHDRMIQAITAFAFGLGLTGIFNVLTGLLARYSGELFTVWYLAGLILFILAVREWRPSFPSLLQRKPDLWSIVSVVIFILFLIPFIPFFVAPEVSTDSLTYHLLLPKIFLRSGNLHFVPLFVEASYPNLAEMNYIGILQLAGEIVCKCFHFWIGIAVLILLAKFVKKINPNASSLLAPALFLSMPVVVIHLGWAWNDFLYTLFVLLSVFFLLHIHLSGAEGQTNKNYLLAGLLAGLASWTKYTFVIYLVTSLLLFLWGARKWKWQPQRFIFYFLGIAIIAPFWLFQNWLFTGNPVYPFLNQIFHSPYWTDAANQYFIHHLRRFEIQDWNWTTYFLFPARIALNPRIIETHTGILPFACIPLLFFRSESRTMNFLKTYLFFGILVWLTIQTETRSILTLFAAFFCIVSVELQEKIRWKSLFAVFISAAIAANFYVAMITTQQLFSPMAYFLGLQSKSHYITQMTPGQAAYDYLNGNPNVKRVLLVSMHGPFYFNHSYFLSDYSDPPVAEVLTQNAGTPEEIRHKLATLGISHVILDPGKYKEENGVGLYSWNKQQRQLFETFLLKNCKELTRFPDAFVYEVGVSR
jgi:Dolichyl-phosphate-mannose-protein mannosyltransferase